MSEKGVSTLARKNVLSGVKKAHFAEKFSLLC